MASHLINKGLLEKGFNKDSDPEKVQEALGQDVYDVFAAYRSIMELGDAMSAGRATAL